MSEVDKIKHRRYDEVPMPLSWHNRLKLWKLFLPAAGGLDKITFESPFQPDAFCDSVKVTQVQHKVLTSALHVPFFQHTAESHTATFNGKTEIFE